MAEGFNFANLYSPTTDTDSFKLGIVLSAQYGLILTFFDVSNVFQTKFIADPQKDIASVYLLYIKNGLNIDSQIIYYVKKIPISGKITRTDITKHARHKRCCIRVLSAIVESIP